MVTVLDEPTDLLIEVTDEARELPEMPPTCPEADHGRGLRIVAALAGAWGVRPIAGDGKCIWLRLDDA